MTDDELVRLVTADNRQVSMCKKLLALLAVVALMEVAVIVWAILAA